MRVRVAGVAVIRDVQSGVAVLRVVLVYAFVAVIRVVRVVQSLVCVAILMSGKVWLKAYCVVW